MKTSAIRLQAVAVLALCAHLAAAPPGRLAVFAVAEPACDCAAFQDRERGWVDDPAWLARVPDAFAGWGFTRLHLRPGRPAPVVVRVRERGLLYVATKTEHYNQGRAAWAAWQVVPGAAFEGRWGNGARFREWIVLRREVGLGLVRTPDTEGRVMVLIPPAADH